jgi:outer membrane autotransporter protein
LGRNSANFNQNIFSAGLSAKYDFYLGREFLLTPSVGLRYQHLRQGTVTESGLALAQKLNAMPADSLVGTLGLSLSRDFLVGAQGIITPAIYVSWNHEFADDKLQTRARYAGYGTYFDISSGRLDRDAMELGVGLKARLMSTNSFELSLLGGYSVEFNRRYQNQQFYAGLNLKF